MTSPGLGAPLASLGGTGRFFPVPERKVMFTSVAKNACTSIKWLVADLAGEDPDRFRPTTGYDPNRAAGIHNRSFWSHAPRLEELSRAERAEIHPDNGWFVFGVTRDPRLRLFSSWQSKYLLANPETLRRPARRELLPRVPECAEDVIEDFAAFVALLSENRKHEAFAGDPHLRGQLGALAPDVVPYSRIYDVSELGDLLVDLKTHLDAQGHPSDVTLRTFNDSPLAPDHRLFENGVKELIESTYAKDFARFGDRWDDSVIEGRKAEWTPEAFAHVRSVVEAHERIYDLVTISRRLERANDRLDRENRRLARRNRKLRAGQQAGQAGGDTAAARLKARLSAGARRAWARARRAGSAGGSGD